MNLAISSPVPNLPNGIAFVLAALTAESKSSTIGLSKNDGATENNAISFFANLRPSEIIQEFKAPFVEA